jgi:hypothetical protein
MSQKNLTRKSPRTNTDSYHDCHSGYMWVCEEDRVTLSGGPVFSAAIILAAAESYRRSAADRDWKTTNSNGRAIDLG